MGSSQGFAAPRTAFAFGLGIGPWPGTAEAVSSLFRSAMPPHFCESNSLPASAKFLMKLSMNGIADHTKLNRM